MKQFSNDCQKSKPKQLQSQSKAQAIVDFSQPWTGGIHEVITSQWKVKVKPMTLLFCNYWPIIGNLLSCIDVNWIISQSKTFMHPMSCSSHQENGEFSTSFPDTGKPLRAFRTVFLWRQ